MKFAQKFKILIFSVILSCSFLFSCDDHPTIRPVVFVHGYSGSAAQFESQAQRFIANGYPLSYLAAYDHDTSGVAGEDTVTERAPITNAAIDEIIDGLLEETGADKVDLIGHSRGTMVSMIFLSEPERAARVAHYVNVDGRTAEALPGNVPTLALWGENNPDSEIVGATNVHVPTQSHIQICTSAESFTEMYRFFNGKCPATNKIMPQPGKRVWIAGKVNYFPVNTGADGTLEIYELDSDTGFRVSEKPVGTWVIGEDGAWGPIHVKKGVPHEFAFEHSNGGGKHYFYREGDIANDYFIRLNTSIPGEGIGALLTQTSAHANILVTRDKEFWGDQGDDNDILIVDGNSVLAPVADRVFPGLSSIFLLDWGYGGHPGNPFPEAFYGTHVLGESDLTAPIPLFDGIAFMSGLDLYMPAASPPDRTIPIVLTPRGEDGATQEINVPNWASDEVRMTILFRDFAPQCRKCRN